ncbi:FAD-binding oxidoreductase [Mucilaginibacter limnophilus]|uniref:D-lactate dehydrogenase (cytochrome) n=1 Tax=Mucilaginibacter limnophilus TaxID=1932778 RepID=A0A3S3TEG2_9SPHI|nr:FAD-binding and (Fe-S)-binding domain-containing protein [Mucilaginibacter limnophilus]RVT97279.1 FAD-binding oxidoreductase [Mucilaginibacter limnophilus]
MDIQKQLEHILPPARIKTRLIDLLSYAADAGFYSLIPKAVVQPVNEQEIIRLFQFSNEQCIPMVFRTGGTSLSGQSITDGILVDLSQYWDKLQIENDGDTVRVQPGITGGMVNTYLKKYKRKIGPDPASINSAMMGGILSNNSSGMCCGVSLNSYHTVKYIRFILPDGKSFNTEDPTDYDRFAKECPVLFNLLSSIRDKLAADTVLNNRIRNKYQIKNTVGYSVNAFIDFQHPLDIMAHLLVGAEGTLAFIAETVMNTVPDYQFKSTAMLYFPDIFTACQALVPLNNAGARAVELMDRASLHAIENMPDLPAVIRELPENASALLVEFQEDNYEKLEDRVNYFLRDVAQLSLLHAPVFTSNPKEQEYFWKVRKGLFPSVGAVRKSGSTVILEDVAFPVAKLGDAIVDLQQLFKRYEYINAIIFGHARDGNIHFLITPEFNSPSEVTRYDLFMKDVVDMVVKKYDGALKAEHGTGRNMAPFVETEWGGEIYELMKQVKQAVDPKNLLNPGVIINDDKNVHIKDIKPLPTVEHEVDKCIECGYCEHKCPSRNLTTTPRRRIVIRRELKKMEIRGDKENHKILLNQYQYDGMDTCAVDGLCATACPVDINTGELIKRLRRENHSPFANKTALWVAKNFGVMVWTARFALKAGAVVNSLFGKKAMTGITSGIKKIIPVMPLWTDQIASPPSLLPIKRKTNISSTEKIIYYPSCISRMLGSGVNGKKNLMETFLSVSEKAGIEVEVPENVFGSCCSQIFSSKGYNDANKYMANVFIERMWQASKRGTLRIVIDVSSCAYSIKNMRHHLSEENQDRFDRLKILDCVDYLHDMVMPKQQSVQKKGSIVVHPVCSLQKMNTQDKFVHLARHYAEQVTVPVHAGCCGMAGDRGFLFPELTTSATMPEALEVKQHKYDGYYSSTKTCEMAMSAAVNENYESILYLLDEAVS